MSATLTKPLLVPDFGDGTIRLYTPDPSTGAPVEAIAYTVNMQTVLDGLFPGQGRIAAPNCCQLHGADLFVALSSSSSQAIIKLPNYLGTPAAAVAQAFIFTLDGNDYVGLAFDRAGNLYVAEGDYHNNQIVRYTGTDAAYPGPGAAAGNSYASKTVIGNAGAQSYFGDLAFDAAGNLWAADDLGSRIVAFDAGALGGVATWHILANPPGPLAVANTNPALSAPASALFAEPEGVDFDGAGNLWVANNNDGTGNPGIVTALTTLVAISPSLQQAILATPAGSILPAAAIVPNGNVRLYQVPNGAGRPQFGGLCIDRGGNRLYVNEEIDGNVRVYDLANIAATPNDPAASVLTVSTSDPGNGGLALIAVSPYIADTATDTGLEPDTTTTTPWESPSIRIVQPSQGLLSVLPVSEMVAAGKPAAIYVQVQNACPFPTLGTETLNLYWGKASTGLGWPAPWNGGSFDPGFPTSSMGGLIASVPVPVIAANGASILPPITWANPPDPAQYTVADGHFCLLARIVSPGLDNDGMTAPEGADLVANVLNNARIAWRNIHLLPIGGLPVADTSYHIILGNYRPTVANMRLTFAVIDASGKTLRTPPGPIALRRLGNRDLPPIPVTNPSAGIGGFGVAPGAQMVLGIDYTAPETETDFALRVSQYDDSGPIPVLIGGQTFVRGRVKGFPAEPAYRGYGPQPEWWWLLAVVLLLFAVATLL